MTKLDFIREEEEHGQILIGTNANDMVLLCDWYLGITGSVPTSEIIKMENLN